MGIVSLLGCIEDDVGGVNRLLVLVEDEEHVTVAGHLIRMHGMLHGLRGHNDGAWQRGPAVFLRQRITVTTTSTSVKGLSPESISGTGVQVSRAGAGPP